VLLTSTQPLRGQAQEHLQAQRWEQANECLQVLAMLEPQDFWCHQWRVVVALALGRPQQAIEAGLAAMASLADDQAGATVPESARQARAGLVYNMAQAHMQLGQHKQAMKMLVALEHAQPMGAYVACKVVALGRQLAHWAMPACPMTRPELEHLHRATLQGERPELALLAYRAGQGMPAIEPATGLMLFDAPELQHQVAQAYLQRYYPPHKADDDHKASMRLGLDSGAPVQVAYVSSDWFGHPMGARLAAVLAQHNAERVRVFVLNYGPTPLGNEPHALQQRLAASGHTWLDVHSWNDARVVQWCREQGIDVAVDLKGLTQHHRMGIFAQRAAPIQVNWLGYAGTLPAPYIDWVVADAQVLPPELDKHFKERVWRLPYCHMPQDPGCAVDPTPQTRAQHGLPQGGMVLAAWHETAHITPEVWAVWMRLLHAHPEAVLWLRDTTAPALEHLQAHAKQAGVDPQRLVFARPLPQDQHLARLKLADLSLDTWPYTAHTMASDALWVGVPHVTCTGSGFAARVGASVLLAAGLPELVAQGLGDYEALAMKLMTDADERAQQREKIAQWRAADAVWGAPRFAQDLEAAWQGMARGGQPG